MPKTLIISDAVLLVCLSLLAGGGATLYLAGPGAVPLNMCVVLCVNGAAMLTAVIMAVTEFFSGIRWLALIAVVAQITATVLLCVQGAVSGWAVIAWTVAWVAVALWYIYLAGLGRKSH